MSSTDLLKARAMVGIAGKYMLAVKGLPFDSEMFDTTWVSSYRPKETSQGTQDNDKPFFPFEKACRGGLNLVFYRRTEFLSFNYRVC